MSDFFINLIPDSDKKLSGIYKITNTINDKVYIGKTVTFQKRYNAYKGAFKKEDETKINPYFLNSIKKHNPENFTFEVVETCSIEMLAERELHWMVVFRSTEADFGYNLRMDSSTGMITHPSTSKKISERIKKEFENGTRSREAVSQWATDLWKDQDKKDRMRKNVSLSKASYFIQRTKTGECVAVWNNINQIIEKNPGYKWQNIYAACNGSKASYMKFLWERVDEVPESLKDKIVTDHFDLTTRESGGSFFDDPSAPNKAEWLYLVRVDDNLYELLGREIRQIFPNLTACFCRWKSDKVVHKGFEIEKVPFVPNPDKTASYYINESTKLLEGVKSSKGA